MLTEKQKMAVAMLYNMTPVKDVAAAAGVHRTTVWRWSKKRDFRKEWQRIDRNTRRRYERWRIKKDIEWHRERDRRMAEADAELDKKLHEIEGKTGKSHQKAVNSAWNSYVNTLFNGRSLAEILSVIYDDKPIRRRRRRRTKGPQH